ncbi:hypothetical protein [Streptomyces niveus]|uniref:hypothetical protein n=1 Tax=Streptomyces niveus TaxID=193462 RepID=UPI003413E44A
MFTAMRMAMLHEPGLSPFGAVPERVRIDRGLEFAADAVEAALGTLAVVMHRPLSSRIERARWSG